MNKLLSVAEIMARYQVSAPTARKLMRQMRHVELPKLMVWLMDVIEWETAHTIEPGRKKARITPMRGADDYHIPRRRA